MLEPQMLVKLIHVISSAVLFCGVLSASLFFTLAYRRGGETATAVAGFCTTAAWVTAAAMVVQPVTGFTLIRMSEDSPMQPWLRAAYILFAATLIAWVYATLQLRKFAAAARDPEADRHLFLCWAPVSWGSVVLVCAIYYLMLAQPSLGGAAA